MRKALKVKILAPYKWVLGNGYWVLGALEPLDNIEQNNFPRWMLNLP